MGLCQYVTFAFMHHPYLICTLFGMPSLHLFTFSMFFVFLYSVYCLLSLDQQSIRYEHCGGKPEQAVPGICH